MNDETNTKINGLDDRLAAIETLLATKKSNDEQQPLVFVDEATKDDFTGTPSTSYSSNNVKPTPKPVYQIVRILGALLVFVVPATLIRILIWLISEKDPDGEIPPWAVGSATILFSFGLVPTLVGTIFWICVRLEYYGFWAACANYFSMRGQYRDCVI